MYVTINVVVLWMLFTLPNSSLHDSESNTIIIDSAIGIFICVCSSLVAYFLLQGSDPGYISQETAAPGDARPLRLGEIQYLHHYKTVSCAAAVVHSEDVELDVAEEPVTSETQTLFALHRCERCQFVQVCAFTVGL